MKYKTLKNMEKATRMIASKGYEWNEANDIAIACFDQTIAGGLPFESYIDRIVCKEIWLAEAEQYKPKHNETAI